MIVILILYDMHDATVAGGGAGKEGEPANPSGAATSQATTPKAQIILLHEDWLRTWLEVAAEKKTFCLKMFAHRRAVMRSR